MQDELDQLIDSALAEYANPEPLAGLELRIVARARALRSRRRWLWGAAALVSAAVLLAVTFQPKPAPVANLTIDWPAPPAPVLTARHTLPPPVKRTAPAPPKRSTFPTIGPLTAEEKLWVHIARSAPEQLLYRLPDDIEIKPIEIAPLDTDGRQ